jgi:ABC-type arginine transport system ATPase subunit
VKTLGLNSKKHERFKKLSGGQKQRLSIALALVGNPTFAVLDELTTGLTRRPAGTPGISSRGQGSSLWTRRRRWRRATTPG